MDIKTFKSIMVDISQESILDGQIIEIDNKREKIACSIIDYIEDTHVKVRTYSFYDGIYEKTHIQYLEIDDISSIKAITTITANEEEKKIKTISKQDTFDIMNKLYSTTMLFDDKINQSKLNNYRK